MVCAPQIRRAGRLWNRRPNRIARHLAVRHLAVRHLAIPHLTVPHPTARHLVVYSLTVSKQGKARRMRRPRPWSPYLHRRSTAYGRARCAGCWRTGSPVLAPAPWPPVSEPSSMRLQQGSEEGLDHLSHNARALAALGLDSTAGAERRIEAISARLNAIYQSKRLIECHSRHPEPL